MKMELAPRGGKLEAYTEVTETLNDAMRRLFGKVFPYWTRHSRLVKVKTGTLTEYQKEQLYSLFEERGMI